MNKTIVSAIKGVYYEWAGKRLQAIADLEVLLNKVVGVGDHTNISEDIKNKYEEIDKYNSLLDTLNEQHGDIVNGVPDDSKTITTNDNEKQDCCEGECDC